MTPSTQGDREPTPVRIAPHPTRPKTYRLDSEIWLPAPLNDVFDFFSDASNLETLTPDFLNITIITPMPCQMRQGLLLDYRIKLWGFPLKWQSEITEWEAGIRFVDEQRKGPYRYWHHNHTFESKDGGTLVGDHVDYAVPGGWLIDRLIVRRDLKKIFDFRHRKLVEIFGG